MALRLRRGTDAERLAITPVAGELVYTTDTKRVYVGDGSTVGGLPIDANAIQSIDSLQDVDTSSSPPVVGQVLKWDGSNWVADDEAAFTGGVVEGSTYRIGIVADDSTLMVDTVNNAFTGDLTGTLTGNVLSTDGSSVLINATTNTITGSFVGDLSGNLDGSIIGPDGSTVIVSSFSETINGTLVGDVFGNVTGDVQGNITGNVYAGDSSTIIDINENAVYAAKVNTSEVYIDNASGVLQIINETAAQRTTVISSSLDNRSVFKASRTSTTDLSLSTSPYGGYYFERDDSINGPVSTGLILGGNNYILFSTDPTGAHTVESNFISMRDGQFGIGTYIPGSELDVRGNAIVSGQIDAASFRGSLVADDSTTIVDAVNNTITVGGFVQFGSYTTAERDALAASNGMVLYNTTTNKFQGYQNSVWINLEDGTAA